MTKKRNRGKDLKVETNINIINGIIANTLKQDILDKCKQLIIDENLNFLPNEKEWSNKSIKYWTSKKNMKLENMVGTEYMDSIDKIDTKNLIINLFKDNKISEEDYIFDVAAGYGRVTRDIFCEYFKNIDVLEPSKALASCLEVLKNAYPMIKNIYVTSVDQFCFERKYNIIFASWLFGNITDTIALQFLVKCKLNLYKNGIIIIKDNIGEIKTHTSGSKVNQKMRTLDSYKMLFEITGFSLTYCENVKDWPEEYYTLKVFILKVI